MLSKYVGEMQISAFPQLALLLFFGAFVAVVGWVVWGMKDTERDARLPLEDNEKGEER